jgi:hypothetical protein
MVQAGLKIAPVCQCATPVLGWGNQFPTPDVTRRVISNC